MNNERTCVKTKKVYSPAAGRKVERCAEYKPVQKAKRGKVSPAKGKQCIKAKQVYSPAAGHKVERCAKFSPSKAAVRKSPGKRTALKSPGKRVALKSPNRQDAAARNPWINFLKNYADKNDMKYNEVLLEMGRDSTFKRNVKAAYSKNM
jgi:hypothetical protein